jgi:hypothetical protein
MIIHHRLTDDNTMSPPPSCSVEHDHPLTCGRRRTHHLHLVAPPTDNRLPRGASRVASPGQAQLQIFDLALIPIVGIDPQINHMKLNEHTRRLLLSPSVRITRSNFFLYFLFFLLQLSVLQLTQPDVHIYARPDQDQPTLKPRPTRT